MTPTIDNASFTALVNQCRRAFSLARLADRMGCPRIAGSYRATGRMLRRAVKAATWERRLAR